MNPPSASSPSELSAAAEQETKALIVRHRPEIDRIKYLDSKGQMAAFAALGVDPVALEEHYRQFAQMSDQLKARDNSANKMTQALGWASLAGGLTGALALGKRLGSGVVRVVAVSFATITAGFAGTFIGSRVFSGNVREQSKQLNIEAKNAFERELAVALENKQRAQETAAASETQSPPAALPAVAARDPSFAAQAAAEKNAPASAVQRA